eukprot:scpid4942/ scgid12078/ Talin-1
MWPFRRKSVGDAAAQQQQQKQRSDGERRKASQSQRQGSTGGTPQQGLPTSEITAEVYYLGALQVSDSKSIPTMIATIGELKSKAGKSLVPGKHARLVEFCLKRDQLTLYEGAGSGSTGSNSTIGDETGGKSAAGGSNTSSSHSRHSRLKSNGRQSSGRGEVLDDSIDYPNSSSSSVRSSGSDSTPRQQRERVPIFRAHCSTIAMCLQENLYGKSKSANTGTEHFALNMTELAPIRMSSGQIAQRRVHWCHVFRAKNHTEAYRLVQCIAYTFMELGQKSMMRPGNSSSTVERNEGSIFSRHDTDSNAVLSMSSSSPSPPARRRRSLNEADSGRGTDTSHHHGSHSALHTSHGGGGGGGTHSRQSNVSIHSGLSGSLSALSGHHGGRPVSAGMSPSHLSGSLGTVQERQNETVHHVTPELRHHNTLSMASSIGSEASGSSQAYSSPGNTLPHHSQAALAVEAELDENSGVHASDLSTETSQLILSNAQLRSNCRLRSSSEADNDYQAALYAIGSGDNEKLQLLLETTIPANGEDGSNHNLMHYAAALENADAVKILSKSGCRLETRDMFGWTPLHRCAVRGCRDVLRLLLKLNAEINAVDHWGSTPLHHCVTAQQGRYLECTYALVEHGAAIGVESKAKVKPTDILPELKEMQKRLVSSLSGALSKLPSLTTTAEEDETETTTALVPSPEVTTIADILEASDDRHSSGLSSPHAPFAPPTTPFNELEDGEPFSADMKAMAALVEDTRGNGDATSWDAQARLKQESLKQLDETYREVTTGSSPSNQAHLTIPGGDLPPLHIPRSNSSVIKEQLDQLMDREMEQLSTRASSNGERDMPSRPMSRRVSASKAVGGPPATTDESKSKESPTRTAPAAAAPEAVAKKESSPKHDSPVIDSTREPVTSPVTAIPKRVVKRHKRTDSADQPSSVSPSPEKGGGSSLDEKRSVESDSSIMLRRSKSALTRKPMPVATVARNASEHITSSPRNTPPKSLSSSSDWSQSRLTPKQNQLGVERPELRPSPLQRNKHSLSQPALFGTSTGTTSSDDGRPSVSRSGNLTDTSQERLRDALIDQEEEDNSEESASSAILHLLYMLSRNPECHQELLAHLALPSNADRLVAMAHAPNTGIEDLSKIAHLLQNMFEVDGLKSRKAAISAGMLNVVISMCNTPRALQLPCLNLLEDLLGAPTERRFATQLSSVNCLPLLDLLIPLDNDSGIDPRRHATPPLHHKRRSSYLAENEYDGRSLASSFSIVNDYSMFIRHSTLKLLSMASYFKKMQKNLNHRRALLLLKERALEDPSHLVSLTLEILANVALQYDMHATLDEHGIPGAVHQFLSSSSSGRQRYHAARLLVYMGKQNVRHMYLFDPKIVNILASNDIITMNSDSSSPARAVTIERLVELLTSNNSDKLWGEAPLVTPIVSTTTATSPANTAAGATGASYSLDIGDESPPLVRRAGDAPLSNPSSKKGMSPGRIIDFVLCIYRTIVHPVIFLRLLIHRFREPRTFSLFDWDDERFNDWGEAQGMWSIDANSQLRSEHLYTMRVLEIWLDTYPAVFQEFPIMLSELQSVLEPMKRVGGPYLECYTRLKQLLKDAARPRELPDGIVPRPRELPMHNELYAQCQQMIVGGEQPCKEDDAIFLAALQIHIENIAGVASARSRFNKFKIREKSSVTIKTKRCLPAELSRNKSVFKKVKSVYQQIADRGLSERNAKHFYVRLCYNMDSAGCVFIKVKEKIPGRNKSIRRLLGLSPHCVVIMDEKTKTLQSTHHFTDIRKWTPLPEKMSIMFEFGKATTVFQLESVAGLSHLRQQLDHCIEELDWQKVNNLDNSPWSLLAEKEGVWGLDAVCSLAHTRAVRETFMIQMDTRRHQEESDPVAKQLQQVMGEEASQQWDNTDDEQDLCSDTEDDDHDTEDDITDPLRTLKELTQTLQEEDEMEFYSQDASTLSMNATKQEMDLSASFRAPFSSSGGPPALSQSFTASSPSFLEGQSRPTSSRRIVSRQHEGSTGGLLDNSPGADTFLSSDHSGFDDAWTSAPRFTDPKQKARASSAKQSKPRLRRPAVEANQQRLDSPLSNRHSNAAQAAAAGGNGQVISASVGDLTKLRSASVSSMKHSHPVSAESLSDSLHALSHGPPSRPGSRPRSRAVTEDTVAELQSSLSRTSTPLKSGGLASDSSEPGSRPHSRQRAHTESEVCLTPSALIKARHAATEKKATPG